MRTNGAKGTGAGQCEQLGLRGARPMLVITDLGMLEPDPETRELVQTRLHPGVTPEMARDSTG